MMDLEMKKVKLGEYEGKEILIVPSLSGSIGLKIGGAYIDLDSLELKRFIEDVRESYIDSLLKELKTDEEKNKEKIVEDF